MKFKSKKDDFFRIANISYLILLILAFGYLIHSELYGAILGLTIWPIWFAQKWFLTRYEIADKSLLYWAGFAKNTIPAETIKKITHKRTIWQNAFWPALARKGLMIRYNAYDDLFVTPADEQGFIDALLAQNNQININSEI
jgi:hypothetical protein